MTRILAAVLYSLLATTTASAGPFGLEKGQSRNVLNIESEVGLFRYHLSAVPKPHPTFVRYSVVAGDETGVCQINAYSLPYTDDAFGRNVRADFDKITSQLTLAYGKSKLTDYKVEGSTLNRENEWLASMVVQEREYYRGWHVSHGSIMKEGVMGISLEVVAIDPHTAFLLLRYHFDNQDNCDTEASARTQGSL